ncbi:MAG: pantoate--beta-alanine ligase [Ginsengibacter sp.]
MILFKHSKDLRFRLDKIKQKKLSVGFVPTMGALHPGHISLIKKSKEQADITLCSIYVNPAQFNSPEDFRKYPVNIEADILMLEESGCDILFIPGGEEIYPDENSKKKHFDIGYLETILEGKFRPGHFQGVCMVVEKLLNIIEPTHLFLGQKDYQQSLIIKKLVGMMSKNIKITICPTLREPNGLAMSSRNLRLSNPEKGIAAELHKSLVQMNHKLYAEGIQILKNQATSELERLGFKIDYLEIATISDLEIIEKYKNRQGLIILIAAFLNNVRLIDNLILSA